MHLKGEKFVYKEDWGHFCEGRVQPSLFQYIIDDDNVEEVKGIPYGLGLGIGQCVYSPDGDYVIGVSYKSHPRKLGAQLATTRPSILFKLDFEGNYGKCFVQT